MPASRRASNAVLTLRSRAISVFTRVCDALWRGVSKGGTALLAILRDSGHKRVYARLRRAMRPLLRMRTVIVAMLILLAPTLATAQNYPDRPIRIMVGFTPGSATDITGRIFAQKLTEALGGPAA